MGAKENFMDTFLTIFLFSPLIVIYWSSTWQLLDIYLLPGNQKLSAFVSVFISVIIMFGSYFTQDILNKNVRQEKYFTYIVVSRLYTYVTAFAYVNNWRGMWMLLDIYTGVTILGAVVNASVGVIALVLLRSLRNVLAAPGGWALDLDTDTHFTVLTRFRTKKGGVLYVLDAVFGVVVLSTLVLLVWRGKWQLLYLAIPVDSDLWRAVINVIAAHSLHIILCIVQYPARRLSKHLHISSPFLQLVLEDCFGLCLCLTSVIYWLGMWSLLDILLADFDDRIKQWPVHFLGFGGLMVLGLSTTLQFTGFFVDGELPDGLGLVVTPTYIKTFWKTSRTLENLSQTLHTVNTGSELSVEATSSGSPDTNDNHASGGTLHM